MKNMGALVKVTQDQPVPESRGHCKDNKQSEEAVCVLTSQLSGLFLNAV